MWKPGRQGTGYEKLTLFFDLFRPDRDDHRVTPVEEGTRYVLSMGVALPGLR
jgi:hypothetical protein